MKPEISISTVAFSTPLDPLQVSFLPHRGCCKGLQVSFSTTVEAILSSYRCRFYHTPTLPPPMPFQFPIIEGSEHGAVR